jgi:N-acetylglucosaminyldiphosphoundecaprenol N-acetyl-beta-D-mannosaminyltransferase
MRLPLPPRFRLAGVPVDRISMDYAAILLVEALLHPGDLPTLTVVGPNAQLVTLAQKDDLFAEAMQQADLAVPDGMSVVLASRMLGVTIPERVTGGDLMERMCSEAAHYGFRVFFLGGLPGAAEMAAFNLRQRYPGLNICGTYCPPRGFENDPAELFWIEKVVEEARPDLLCVAFGAPKQEIWMQRHRDRLNVGVILPVGAAFDTQAGLQRRAPQWMQRNALEWLFRLMMEPRRLWRRYLIGNTQFIFLVLQQWGREKRVAWKQRLLRRTTVTHEQTAGD